MEIVELEVADTFIPMKGSEMNIQSILVLVDYNPSVDVVMDSMQSLAMEIHIGQLTVESIGIKCTNKIIVSYF